MDQTWIEDAAFVFAVFVAPLIAVALFTAVVATQRSRRVVVATCVLTALVVAALGTYWAMWGVAFDEVDAGGVASPGAELAMNASVVVSGVAGVLMLLLSTALATPFAPSRSLEK